MTVLADIAFTTSTFVHYEQCPVPLHVERATHADKPARRRQTAKSPAYAGLF